MTRAGRNASACLWPFDHPSEVCKPLSLKFHRRASDLEGVDFLGTQPAALDVELVQLGNGLQVDQALVGKS